MQKHFALLAISLAFVAGLSLTVVNANPGLPSSVTDLESSFAGFETFLTDLTNEVDANTLAIANLQGNATIFQDHQDSHHSQFNVNDADISNMKSRLTALENEKSEFNTELRPLASKDGRIKLVTANIVYYGDELCKIDSGSGGTDLYIQFGDTTTVRHQTDCEVDLSGHLLTLDSATDETFNKGDVLVIEQDFTNGFFWVEIFQEKN